MNEEKYTDEIIVNNIVVRYFETEKSWICNVPTKYQYVFDILFSVKKIKGIEEIKKKHQLS